MPTTVVHLINSLERGGAESVLARLVARTQPDPQHAVITLLPGGPLGDDIRATGAPVHELLVAPDAARPRAVGELISLLRRHQPTILSTWLYQASLVGTFAHLSVPGARLIWNLRGTAKDPATSSLSSRLSVAALARLSRRPWAIAVNSRAGRYDHAQLGFHPRRWAYVPNGFDASLWLRQVSEREQVRRELQIPSQAVVLAMVARAEPQKDHTGLLTSFTAVAASHPTAHLLLIGRGTEQLPVPPTLRGRVTTTGARSDVARLLQAADLGVLSSAYGEGLPNAVAEMMLLELPCVVTDSGDAGILVGNTGRVVAPRAPEQLTRAICELLAMPAAERATMGARARQRVIDLYSSERMIAGFQRLWAAPGSA